MGLKGFAVAVLFIGELPMLQLDWCVKSFVFGAMISYVAVIELKDYNVIYFEPKKNVEFDKECSNLSCIFAPAGCEDVIGQSNMSLF